MIAACYVLHYGKEWLQWSMRSVKDFVDDIYIFYSATPSHGHRTTMTCPETRNELYDIARGAYWIDCGPFGWEGQHRDFACDTLRDAGYDQILVVDADEIWPPELLHNFIEFSKNSSAKKIRVGMRHFWRSLKWVCDDSTEPLRMFNVHADNKDEVYYPLDGGKVYHMGYAQSATIMLYKISIHGHKSEWRGNWYQEKFLNWKPGDLDVHPTCERNFWDPKPFVDEDGTLEYLVGDHPYYNLDIIR